MSTIKSFEENEAFENEKFKKNSKKISPRKTNYWQVTVQ
jgi:hypothetical protein